MQILPEFIANFCDRRYDYISGEKVNVEPIVTIPGWFVKRLTQEGIPVMNPKKEVEIHITSSGRKNILSDGMITRIVHQIDQRCRNIEPKNHLV